MHGDLPIHDGRSGISTSVRRVDMRRAACQAGDDHTAIFTAQSWRASSHASALVVKPRTRSSHTHISCSRRYRFGPRTCTDKSYIASHIGQERTLVVLDIRWTHSATVALRAFSAARSTGLAQVV
ncbi:hypothetical protein BC628DRAFT_715475 [Trametes gibbosa]|nr:hypothetical protein BC628DRAFT_715475 [Trametes gibbosa]